MIDIPSETSIRSRLFRKVCHFYCFLEGGELGLLAKLIEETSLGRQRLNEILDWERVDEEITEDEMEEISKVIGIPLERLIWNQIEMNHLYGEFNLDFDVDVRDINKRVVSVSLSPLQFARAVMAMIYTDGDPDPKEKKYFEYLKRSFSLTEEVIIPMEDSEKHFHQLIHSLPSDTRFLSIVVKWIIGAVFADGEVSEEEVGKLKELLNEIQTIRGDLNGVDINLKASV